MNPHDMQLLISLIEDEFESSTHRSVAATIDAVRNELRVSDPIDADLFKHLRHKHGSASGRIARVATKQLYEHSTRVDKEIIEIIDDAAEFFDKTPRTLSDDALCRYLRQA